MREKSAAAGATARARVPTGRQHSPAVLPAQAAPAHDGQGRVFLSILAVSQSTQELQDVPA